MFDIQDRLRNEYMLDGPFARKGYDWWWHSFTAVNKQTGEEKPFFVEYFLCNPALGGKEPVFGQLPANKAAGIKPSYMMVKAGCWGEDHMQLHRFFGWDDVKVKKEGAFVLRAEDCFASDVHIKGSISITKEEGHAHPEWMCDSGEMSWDLKINKINAFNVGYGASTPLREAKAFEMYWHAEGMKSEYEGTIILNGAEYEVIPEKSFGYADKNWGRGFTSPWVWLSSNCMTSRLTGRKLEHSVFDIGGGRPKVYCLPLDKKLLGAFIYEGEEFEYNFSKIWTMPKTTFRCWETDSEVKWRIIQENYNSVMETKVSCRKKDMLLVNYEAPDGSKRHNRLWNGGNGIGTIRLFRKQPGIKGTTLQLIDHIDVSHIGCEYGEYC